MKKYIIALYAMWFVSSVDCFSKELQGLNIGTFENFPPFTQVVDEKKKIYDGISIRVLRNVLPKLGYKIDTLAVLSQQRLLKSLSNGEIHLCPNYTPTEARFQVARFTLTPHIDETHELIIRKEDEKKIKFNGDLNALKQYTFGSLAGWTHGPEFDRSSLKKEARSTTQAQIKSLLAGRFDIAVANGPHFKWEARKLGVEDKIKILTPALTHLPTTMSISKKWDKDGRFTAMLEHEVAKYIKTNQYKQDLAELGLSHLLEIMKSDRYREIVKNFKIPGFDYRMKVPEFD